MSAPSPSTAPISPSAELALTERYPPTEFGGLNALKRAITERQERLNHGGQDQYLSFCNITPWDFRSIEARRVHLGRGIAFTYFGDIETLIIKIPTKGHEKAHASFGHETYFQLRCMGLTCLECCPINATTFRGGNDSSKEGDSAYQNQLLRPSQGDWPHLVIEAGYSERLTRLHMDARWWIENSTGQVLIVIIIWIDPSTRTIKIEKWIPTPQPFLRRSPRLISSSTSVTRTAEISIDQSSATSVVRGAPLRLEFDRVVGRPAQNAGEKDVLFTWNDLDAWGRSLWVGI